MTDLPAVADLTSPSTTEASFQSAIGDLHQVVAELLGGSDMVEYTIATGSITPLVATFRVDTESDAASDDLANIVPTNLGEKVILVRGESAARVVTLKHLATGSGQMRLLGAADAVLNDTTKWVMLRYNSVADEWVEVMRNWGVYAPQAGDQTAVAATHNHDSLYEAIDAEIVRADVADIFSVGYQHSFDTIAFAASVTPDFTKQRLKKIAITGSITFNAQNNTPGGECFIEATMDGTGGYTVTLSAFNILSGTFDNSANAVNILHFIDWGGQNIDLIIYQRP